MMDFDRLFEVFIKVMKVVFALALLLGLLGGIAAPGELFWSPALLMFIDAIKWGAMISAGVAVADQFCGTEKNRPKPLWQAPEKTETPAAPPISISKPKPTTVVQEETAPAPALPETAPHSSDGANVPETTSSKAQTTMSLEDELDASWSDRAGAAMDEAREDLES